MDRHRQAHLNLAIFMSWNRHRPLKYSKQASRSATSTEPFISWALRRNWTELLNKCLAFI
jgi:hypothetical protein